MSKVPKDECISDAVVFFYFTRLESALRYQFIPVPLL